MEKRLLKITQDIIQGKRDNQLLGLNEKELVELFCLAKRHKLFNMVYEYARKEVAKFPELIVFEYQVQSAKISYLIKT